MFKIFSLKFVSVFGEILQSVSLSVKEEKKRKQGSSVFYRRIYYIRMPDPTWAEGLHAQHASVWAGQVIKGNVFIGSSHTWWNYPYSCINVPFSDRQLGKIAPKQTHPFSIWPFRILSVCVFSNICEFLVDWTCSKWALESASRQDWDADGGRERGPLVQ